MAGGGGGSQTTEAGLPDWAQPYAKEGLEGAVGDYRAGRFGHVEGLSDPQADAFGRQLELGQRGGTLDRLASVVWLPPPPPAISYNSFINVMYGDLYPCLSKTRFHPFLP